MIIKKLKLLPIIFIGAFVGSCTYIFDKPPINNTYLQSKKYQHYKNQVIKERNFRDQNKRNYREQVHSLAQKLVNGLKDNNAIPSLTLSEGISYERIAHVLEKRKGWIPFAVGDKRISNPIYTYSAIGKYAFGNIMLLFFVLKENRIYQKAVLMMATAQDGLLKDIRAIAFYHKDLTTQSTNNVMINAKKIISVKTERTLFYPITMQNTYKYGYQKHYKISEYGRILNSSKD